MTLSIEVHWGQSNDKTQNLALPWAHVFVICVFDVVATQLILQLYALELINAYPSSAIAPTPPSRQIAPAWQL